MRLNAVSPEALAAGLTPDMTLADARARLPDIDAVAARPDLDDALLARLRDDFERFTPFLAIDTPHGVMLDITGCAHLFGGEAAMAARVRQRCRAAGLHVCCALAGTPDAARALARFAPAARDAPLIVPPGQERAAVSVLPVAALELPPGDLTTLLHAGLKRLADVIDRDSISLAARFGAAFPTQLARLTGAEDARITPVRPPPPCLITRVLHEPVARQEHIETLLGEMLLEAAQRMESTGMGGLRFDTVFYRTDGLKRSISVRLSRPTRDPAVVAMLLRERLNALDDPVDPGFGFDQICLVVPETGALDHVQHGLSADIAPANNNADAVLADLDRLADRLTARLGPLAVLGVRPHGSHLPERAAILIPAHFQPASTLPGQTRAPARSHVATGRGNARQEAEWRTPCLEDPPLRPLHIFRKPEQVEALAEAPDGYPLRFRWRSALHDVAAAEGPERIAGEWWRAPGQQDRDYYRVEDREGRRFWLFRIGVYGAGTPPRWLMHGLFA